MTARSYSDLSDSATTFDPEEQFDRDIDERMVGMTKEETVARIIDPDAFSPSMSHADGCPDCDYNRGLARLKARAAIVAADKWDAEQEKLDF